MDDEKRPTPETVVLVRTADSQPWSEWREPLGHVLAILAQRMETGSGSTRTIYQVREATLGPLCTVQLKAQTEVAA